MRRAVYMIFKYEEDAKTQVLNMREWNLRNYYPEDFHYIPMLLMQKKKKRDNLWVKLISSSIRNHR